MLRHRLAAAVPIAAGLAVLAIPACTPGAPASAPPDGALAPAIDGGAEGRASVPHETSCDDPYGAWCGIGAQADRERAERLAHVARSIEDVTLGAVSARLGLAPATREAWLAALSAMPPEDAEAGMRLFRKLRASEVEQRVAPLRATAADELARTVAIARARLEAEPADALRDAALARLDRAHLAWLDLGDPSPFHARAMRRGCGDSLLVDDAWVDKSATAITLCPGFLLVSREGADDATFRARIALLLAHEIGHVIVGPTESEAEAERAAEIAADAWAAEIVAERAREIEHPIEREAFLVSAIEPICAPSGDRIHPGGAERVAIYAAALCAD